MERGHSNEYAYEKEGRNVLISRTKNREESYPQGIIMLWKRCEDMKCFGIINFVYPRASPCVPQAKALGRLPNVESSSLSSSNKVLPEGHYN